MAEASIVFRNEDMTGTGKIYVNTLEAAAELAAKYRNASYYVDVINAYDEVAIRWEQGAPDWRLGHVTPTSLCMDAYPFEKEGELYRLAEFRHYLLSEAVPFAFDCAVGKWDDHQFDFLLMQTEHHGGGDIWPFIADAKQAAREAEAKEVDKWAWHLSEWMCDADRLFAPYLIEFHALEMHLNKFMLGDRVSMLGVELAEVEARKLCS